MTDLQIISTLGLWPLLPILVGALVYTIRRWFPRAWAPLTTWPDPEHPASHVVQGMPSLIVGAIVGASATGDIAGSVVGAVWTAAAPIGHHILKAAPVQYRGALQLAATVAKKRANAWAKAERARRSTLFLVLLVLGCVRTPANSAEALNDHELACVAAESARAAALAAECRTETCIDDVYAEAEKEKLACLKTY